MTSQPEDTTMGTPLDPEEFRVTLRKWIEAHEDGLASFRAAGSDVDVETRLRAGTDLLRLLDEAGWARAGWPAEVGGTGGDARLRGILYEELEIRGVPVPEQLSVLETVGPAVVRFAPDLAAALLPHYFAGAEFWCQGFSEPEAGSDLASLRCRAVQREDGSFVVSGQKIWSSFGHLADRMVALVRTGTLESRHRGLTMLLVDLSSPGVSRAPIRLANEENELAEVFFDEVEVPADRRIGAADGGWAVAMYLLQFERGMYAWMRHGHLHRQLAAIVSRGVDGPSALRQLGAARVAHRALRARTWRTLGALADGRSPGPDISVDKILLATAEQRVLDVGRACAPEAFVLSDSTDAQQLRSEWFYTRAASIYGGSAEVQRTILADHVLGLPKEAKA